VKNDQDAPPAFVETPLPFARGLGLKMPNWAHITEGEWQTIEAKYKETLEITIRQDIDKYLFMSAVDAFRVHNAFRGKVINRRLSKIHDGLKAVLEALDYPFAVNARVSMVVEEKWSQNSPGFQLWKTLKDSGLNEHWTRIAFSEGFCVSKADAFEDELFRLHAMLHLIDLAVSEWPKEQGGKRASRDLACIRKIRDRLIIAKLPAGYSNSDDEGSWGGLRGGLPTIVRELWIARPCAFVSAEPSQFAKLIRKSKGA
jgi:hypothetical protein